MISYAQNFEDVMLARVFGSKQTGFYIDVGAMHPVEDSVTKHFYNLGWCGINIEPNPHFYKRLVAERTRDVNLNVALGDADETLPFYEFETLGVSTFNPRFRRLQTDRGSEFHTRQQKVTTLANICERYEVGEIDFLKIDVEGWEGPIIRGSDWSKFRPVALVVEGTEPGSHIPVWKSWEPHLIGAGYAFVYYDGINRFYLRHESLDALRDCFAFPPNVLDGFKLVVTEEAERERDRLCAENWALESRLELVNQEHTAAIGRQKEDREAAVQSLRREWEEAIDSLKSLNRASTSDLEAANESLRAVKAKLDLALLEQGELATRAERQRSEVEATTVALRKSEADAEQLEERLMRSLLESARLERVAMESRIGIGRIAQEKALAGQFIERLLGDLRAEREHRERAEREWESLRQRLDATWAAKEKERLHNEYLTALRR